MHQPFVCNSVALSFWLAEECLHCFDISEKFIGDSVGVGCVVDLSHNCYLDVIFGIVVYAACQLELGRWEGAEAELRRVLEATDDAAASRATRAEARRMLGEILLELGRDEEALRELSAPDSELDPAVDARDAWLLGRALGRAGRREEARDHFLVLETGPSADLAELALARLSVEEGRPEEALRRLERGGFRSRLSPQDRAGWHARTSAW